MTINALPTVRITSFRQGLFWRSILPIYPAVGRIRPYTSQTSSANPPSSSRKQVTIINDDGRIQWKDLSVREKAARTTQQTFNFGVVLTGLLMTVRRQQERLCWLLLILAVGWSNLPPLYRGLLEG